MGSKESFYEPVTVKPPKIWKDPEPLVISEVYQEERNTNDLDDRSIADMVNKLVLIAASHWDSQSLRQRVSNTVNYYLKGEVDE